MSQTQTAPTELGSESIGQLLKKYAVPGIIAMTASSLYNMVDSIYIGHIPETGSLAISGLAVTFPLMNLSTALGTLVGVGAATMISVLLGQRNYRIANKVLANEVTLNCIVGLLFTVFCLMFLDPILNFFGASANTLKYARDYMEIILYGNVITHLYFGLNSIIRSSGNPKMAMGLTLFTVILNSILDPIFIFLMNSASCIVTMFINQQLLKYGGDLAIGAFGIINRINFLFIMVVMGFNQGMQPIAGYNFGARKYSRVREVFLRTSMWATIVTGFWFIASEFFPGVMVSIFTNDPSLKEVAEKGLRVMNPVVLIVGWQMVSTNLFQSLGMVRKSIFLSLSRQLLYLVPLLYLMPPFFGIHGVFAAFPISDALACVTTLIMIGNLMRKFSKLKDGDEPTILGSAIS